MKSKDAKKGMSRTRRNAPPSKRRNLVGPRIVYAWFQTVINPLLVELRREQSLLGRKNWTWVFRPGALEFIGVTRDYLPEPSLDNFEQFLGLNEDLRETCDDHDQGVPVLFVQCKLLQMKVEESPRLRQIYERLTRDKLPPLGVGIDDVFGAYPPEDHLSLLAQYIVNHTEALPDYYTTARLWNPHRDDFLAVLSEPDVAATESETLLAGESLLKTTRRLVTLLEKKRQGLSLKYDVPYVAPPDLSIWEARR